MVTNLFPSEIQSSSSTSSSSSAAASVDIETTTQPPLPTKDASKKRNSRTRIKQSIMDAIAGASAGAIAKTAVAPIERVKLLMQLQKSILASAPPPPTTTATATATPATASSNPKQPFTMGSKTMNISGSAINVARTVYHEEGILAFWRGNTPNVLRQGGAAALNFMLMDWYKCAVTPVLNATLALPSNRPRIEREKRRKIMGSFLSGGLAGGTTTTFLYPIEFLRTRLALDVGGNGVGNAAGATAVGRMYPRGMRDVFCTIWKTDGLRGMYQGYGIALGGVVLYRALHLGGYDACKTELLHRRRRQQESGVIADAASHRDITMTMMERFAVAQIVSIVAGTICYPIDSVRRRLMMQAGQPVEDRLYFNSVHAFRRIAAEEGLKGFYLGIGPNLVRSIGGALLLVSYDVFKGMVC